MTTVGLTGGYASGKTFVASYLEQLGCHLIYADRLGHAVLEPGRAAYKATVQSFGRKILNSDGTIHRKKLGALVFNDRQLLDRLNAIVHPAVFELEEQLLAQFSADDPQGIAIVEAAILVETGRFKVFDRLIVTACDEAIQIARGMERDGGSREEVLARISKQMPLEEKKSYADYIVDTNGTQDETIQQVNRIYSDLRRLATAHAAVERNS